MRLWFKKKWKQRTFCYCPNYTCDNELVASNSFVEDKELVKYECTQCGTISFWLFDAPAPILIRFEIKDD